MSPRRNSHGQQGDRARSSAARGGSVLLVLSVACLVVTVACMVARLVPDSFDYFAPIPQLAALAGVSIPIGITGAVLAFVGRRPALGMATVALVLVSAACSIFFQSQAGLFRSADALVSPSGSVVSRSGQQSLSSNQGNGSDARFDALDDAGAWEAGASGTLSVMTLNTHVGQADAQGVVSLVREFDVQVLCLQEMTEAEERALVDAGLADALPYRVGSAPGDQVWSAYPLVDATEDAVGYSGSSMAAGTVSLDGVPLRFVSVHTCSPSPGYEAFWNESLADLVDVKLSDTGVRERVSYVLAGDFNATTDNASLRGVIQALDMHDAAVSLGSSYRGTWPAVAGSFGLVAIDHVLMQPGVRAEGVRYASVEGSDHLAMVVDLSVAGS